LQRPDYPGLVQLVLDDINYKDSGGFGTYGIHRQLLQSQLDELLKLKPELLNQQPFVVAYLMKLQPGADLDWRHDKKELAAYLDRLMAFADRLDPVHNSLKAHILYHRLLLDRSQGVYNKERFLKYLALPRPVGYISQAMQESEAIKRYAVELNANYEGATQ